MRISSIYNRTLLPSKSRWESSGGNVNSAFRSTQTLERTFETTFMTTLIVGGAGYIGSHMVHAFVDAGEPVVVLDNLSTGFRFLIPNEVPFVPGNTGDCDLLAETISLYHVNAACDAVLQLDTLNRVNSASELNNISLFLVIIGKYEQLYEESVRRNNI
jgi:hypothetical protein